MIVFFKFFFFILFFSSRDNLCSGLNAEGLVLLRFREQVVKDPFNALSTWNGESHDANPCSWFGVVCSDDGKVVSLNLKDLSLKGTLTPELGKLAHIRFIVLRNNSFHGTIPREIVDLKELQVLDLGYNDFTGPLPFELGDNASLATISLDNNNRFLDGIFTEQYKLMSENQVDGHRPTLKATCDDNHPTWNIGHFIDHVRRMILEAPKAFSSKPLTSEAPLQKKKHSHKSPAPAASSSRGSHKKPHKQFLPPSPSLSPGPSPSPSPSPFASHKRHPPAPAPAPTRKRIESSSPKKSPSPAPAISSHSASGASNLRKAKSHEAVVGLSVAGGSLVIIVAVIAVIVCRSSRMVTVKPWATGLSGQLQKAFVSGVPKLKRSELETACEDFSNIVGTLVDSAVYKGTLSNGVEIAVVSSMAKSNRQWSKHLQTQFRKKIETLSKVNHKNFINILGYCEEEKPFSRMMVFEYAPNGTLFEHLHIQEAERLDWRMRLRIMMGTAYCLEHMHQLDQPLPLRHLQSSSVHLSEDYAAKVSDFSFWTEKTLKKMDSSSMRSPSMQLMETSMADVESNVYSFGLLLFEIITGKIPFTDNGEVEDWVWEYLGGQALPREAIDPILNTFQEVEMQKLFEIIKDCVKLDPTERPTMRDVTLKLKEATAMEPDGAVPRLSSLWWAELEIMTA